MPIDRFFDSHLDAASQEGKLVGDEKHHACKVFRLKPGDHCEIINGQGIVANVIISEITKNELFYEVNTHHIENIKIPQKTLIIGMPKLVKLELICEKATELGVDEIILFNADRSEKTDLSKNQMERLYNILISALKQSGRLFLPSLQFRPHLENCFESDRTYFFGDLRSKTKLSQTLSQRIGFVIGPESGFSDNELSLLEKMGQGVYLSVSILRCETAAISSAFLMSYLQDNR